MATFNDHLMNLPDPSVSVKKSLILPTSGKMESGKKLCEAEIDTLNRLMREVNSAYDKFREAVDIKRELIQNTAKVANAMSSNNKVSNTSDYIVSRIESGVVLAQKMLVEIKKVLNPNDLNYLMMKVNPSKNLDFAILSTDFWEYASFLIKVNTEASKIKIKYRPTMQMKLITGSGGGLKIDNPEATNKTYSKIVYRMELRAILPDNTEMSLHQYISSFMYSVDYDEASMPIYSAVMKLPETIINNLKNHFEKTKFYLTIKMFEKRGDNSEYRFEVPTLVLDNVPLIGVDPKFPMIAQRSSTNDMSRLPIHDCKIDFVSFREQMLNGKVKARVFNDCTVMDVIGALCSDLNEIYKKKEMDSKREVKFAITPSENNQVYEQIMVNPGTFTHAINSLQARYGIYQTGVRIQFDNNHAILEGKKQETTPLVTIKDKGGVVPLDNSMFTNVVIECVSPQSTTPAGFESGYILNKVTQTLTIRSDLPYLLEKVNSENLTRGQAIRVQNSSSNDHVTSVCDDDSMDEDKWSFVWSKYDNMFNLSQIQDDVREKNLQCTVRVQDVNVLSLNDNANYILKFFSNDDQAATGEYRLARCEYFFKMSNNTSDKMAFEVMGGLHFKNLRELRNNGTPTPRTTYATKLANALSVKSYNYEPNYNTDGINTEVSKNSSYKLNTNDVFSASSYFGKKDYHGVPFLPTGVPIMWNMGGGFTFYDVLNTADGGSVEQKVLGLTSNLEYFINVQKFCTEILGPVVSLCGRFPIDGGKIKSLYRYSSPTNETGSSQHLMGLAADIRPSAQAGDFLCDAYYKIANSNIPFDQLIFESDGKEWKFIHISMANNSTPRRQLIINLGLNKANKYYMLDKSRMKSALDLYFKKDKILITLNLKEEKKEEG